MATARPVSGHACNSSYPGSQAGSHRFRAGRGWRRSGLVLGVAAGACLGLIAVPGTAVAAPSAAELTAQVTDANRELEVVSEQVNRARDDLAAQQAAQARAEQDAADAQARLAGLDGQVRELARGAYTGNRLTGLDVLLTSRSVADLVGQLGTLDAIAGHQNAVLQQVDDAANAARTARRAAEAAAAAAQRTLDEVTAEQSQLQAQIADYQRQYAALTAAEQQAVVQAVAGTPEPAPAPPAAGDAAPAAAAAPAAVVPATAAPAAVPAVAGAAAVAVRTALAQVGKPYAWGASGPGSFDCSGLTKFAYAAAGVALPHSSGGQAGIGRPVSRSQLQPGDLVFFGSPVHHVGMYVGGGRIVHAATPGVPIQVVDLSVFGDYNSARRPVG